MTKWDGLGTRITQRLHRLGYWNIQRQRPDLMRFGLENRYPHIYLYRWINMEICPDHDNLMRLAGDLGVSPAWLLMGDEGLKKPRRRLRNVERHAAGMRALERVTGG